jgi:hypothetical protein
MMYKRVMSVYNIIVMLCVASVGGPRAYLHREWRRLRHLRVLQVHPYPQVYRWRYTMLLCICTQVPIIYILTFIYLPIYYRIYCRAAVK